mgnify:FL=1
MVEYAYEDNQSYFYESDDFNQTCYYTSKAQHEKMAMQHILECCDAIIQWIIHFIKN